MKKPCNKVMVLTRALLPAALVLGLLAPAPSSSQTLRYAITTFGAENLDPTVTSITTSLGVAGPMWDWLTDVTADGTLRPGLALTWKPDGSQAWILTLRKGVIFHDGSEMTAEDVKFTLQVGFGRPKAKSSRAGQFRKKIKDVKVIDRYTVRIESSNPWPTFPHDVSNQPGIEGIVLPKNYITRIGWDAFAKKPMGTGAWKFVKREVGNVVDYAAHTEYWGTKPKFSRLRILLVPEGSTRVAMLKSGQVDIANVSIDDAAEMTKAGFSVIEDPQPSSVRIQLYASYYKNAGPIGKKKVRQALNLAIDKNELVRTLFRGRGKPAAVFPASAVSIGFPANLKPYPFDPKKARALMAEAGYANGFKIKLFSLSTGGFNLHQQVSEAVAGYWQAIGVNTSIVPTDIGAFRPLYMGKRTSDRLVGQASIFATTGRLNGADDLRIWWTESGRILKMANNVEPFYNKARAAKTVDEIAQNVKKAYQIIYDDARGVPLADVSGVMWAYGNRVASVKVRPHRGYITPTLSTAIPK